MYLKYRGIFYKANPTAIKTRPTQSSAKYRGQSYQLRQSEVQILPSNSPMIYRGVSYNQGSADVSQAIPQFKTNSSLA